MGGHGVLAFLRHAARRPRSAGRVGVGGVLLTAVAAGVLAAACPQARAASPAPDPSPPTPGSTVAHAPDPAPLSVRAPASVAPRVVKTTSSPSTPAPSVTRASAPRVDTQASSVQPSSAKAPVKPSRRARAKRSSVRSSELRGSAPSRQRVRRQPVPRPPPPPVTRVSSAVPAAGSPPGRTLVLGALGVLALAVAGGALLGLAARLPRS